MNIYIYFGKVMRVNQVSKGRAPYKSYLVCCADMAEKTSSSFFYIYNIFLFRWMLSPFVGLMSPGRRGRGLQGILFSFFC